MDGFTGRPAAALASKATVARAGDTVTRKLRSPLRAESLLTPTNPSPCGYPGNLATAIAWCAAGHDRVVSGGAGCSGGAVAAAARRPWACSAGGWLASAASWPLIWASFLPDRGLGSDHIQLDLLVAGQAGHVR
jgi:hypothetical protein